MFHQLKILVVWLMVSLTLYSQEPGIVQSIINDASNNRTTPSMNVVSGHTLVACVSSDYTTLTSSPAATWTLDVHNVNSGGTGTAANILHAVAPSTGAMTVTEPGDGYLMVTELNDQVSSTVDGTASNTNNGASSTTLNITTTINGSLPVNCISDSNGSAQFNPQYFTQYSDYETADGGNSVMQGFLNTGVFGTYGQTYTLVTDDHGAFSAVAFQPTTRAISTQFLPDGCVGCLYSWQLKQYGGSGSITWSKTGSLPPGLSLSAGGLISGTISAPSGTYNFTANDGSVTRNLSITTKATQNTLNVVQVLTTGFTMTNPVTIHNCSVLSVYGYGRHNSQGYLPPDDGSAVFDDVGTVYHRLTTITGGNQSGTYTWIGEMGGSGTNGLHFPAIGLGTELTINWAEISGMQCNVIDQGEFTGFAFTTTSPTIHVTTSQPNEWAYSTISTTIINDVYTPSAGWSVISNLASHGTSGMFKKAITSPSTTSVSYGITGSFGGDQGSESIYGFFPSVTGVVAKIQHKSQLW